MKYSLKFVVALNLICMSGCGAAAIYKYYTLDGVPDGCYKSGQLLGKLGSDGWPDVPFLGCEPTATNKAPCVVQFLTDYIAKDTELLNCRQQLSDLQAACPKP